MLSVSVIGLGYIGLPTAAMFASKGIRVIGIDINSKTVDTINRGGIHIIEPELEATVEFAVAEGLLTASTVAEPADAFLIAVPTPFRGNDHEPDLRHVEAAARMVAAVLRPGNLVVLESTSPVGATEQLEKWLAEERPDLRFPQEAGVNADVQIAYCPERVLPGNVMRELIHNDRVIGGLTEKCSAVAVGLYEIFVQGKCVITDSRTAEMAKLTENSFRDVNIAFANELSIICDKQQIDVWELIAIANRHPRVNILQPGPGVGGHCIAVDPWFIVSKNPEQTRLIRTARDVNDAKPAWVLAKIREAIAKIVEANPEQCVADVSVACYGLTFKPNIDDLRESPAMEIVRTLSETHPGKVLAVEPNIEMLPGALKKAALVSQAVAQEADIHVLLVAHRQFSNLDPSGIRITTCR